MDAIRTSQLWLGALFVFAFLVTGVFMARGFPDLYGDHEGVRMMYRATHIYLLFASLLNMAAGLVPAVPGAPAWSGRAELVARIGLLLAPPLLLMAFFIEPTSYALDRPLTFSGVLASLAAVAVLLLARLGETAGALARRRLAPRRAPVIREAVRADLAAMQAIRAAAFAPVFRAFRQMLGDAIYERAQKHEDEAQSDLLPTMFEDAAWTLFVAEVDGEIVGFVTMRLDRERRLGEIGLNAVAPAVSARGIGATMYRHVLDQMRAAGVEVATVATGGDASHTPARRAYERVGFDRATPGLWMCQRLD